MALWLHSKPLRPEELETNVRVLEELAGTFSVLPTCVPEYAFVTVTVAGSPKVETTNVMGVCACSDVSFGTANQKAVSTCAEQNVNAVTNNKAVSKNFNLRRLYFKPQK